MCGICGTYSFKEKDSDRNEIESMLSSMKHRGPDDEGVLLNRNLGLGHVRLSIIDLSEEGQQPFFSENKRYSVVFNGEIYNYLELKKELENDFNFRTKTDTEVLLNAYLKWGKDCLHRFNGMFSFAIVDLDTNEIFCARDRFGIKPFYYVLNEDEFIFSSEIKAILKIRNIRQANEQIIRDFLVFDRVQHSDNTFYRDIKKLPHGHSLKIKGKTTTIEKWYDLDSTNVNGFSDPQEFLKTFDQSVQLRLRSDVKLGAMLSGGLDSSSIVSDIITNSHLKDLETYSAVYPGYQREDESKYIDLYKDQIKQMYRVSPQADDLHKDLDHLIDCMEEPFTGLSVYAGYKVLELASKSATVVLNGQGADEHLGGYDYFFGMHFKTLWNELRLLKLSTEIYQYMIKNKSTYGLKSFMYFLLPENIRNGITTKSKAYVNGDWSSQLNDSSELQSFYGSKDFRKMVLNHFEYKMEHLLLWGDKLSMNFSLELRFPFLDHNLVERMYHTDQNLIMNKGRSKVILREAMKGIIPEQIRNRYDKVGFEVPSQKWFVESPFKERWLDILHSAEFNNRDWINAKGIRKLENDPTKHYREIWKLFNLEMWLQKIRRIE